ncbi:MAG: nucleotide-binding protein [Deltaproteobacteria bacterium]|nr:nucleotide-binding protein [Deltaproteobacteria bacterium]
MYSLLVSYQVTDEVPLGLEIEKNRFLEYTNDNISGQLMSLSNESMDCIKSWPCILMQEGRGQEVAHVAKITDISLDAAKIQLTFAPLASSFTLINDSLWKLREDLDISQFEFNRNHWAFKGRDLFPILGKAGFVFEPSLIARFQNRQLTVPTRGDLIQAMRTIASWSHTDIDEFLLEVGISDLRADRAIGSIRNRANAIIKYAIENPGATTAENYLFSAYIMRSVAPPPNPFEESKESWGSDGSTVEPEIDVEDRNYNARNPNRVFIVHGQNEVARDAVVSLLGEVGLEGIVLHEQPNMGRHLLTKFIEEAELVTFAIVLMTDDDVGGLHDGAMAPRARQNVILELGYFLSHLGQHRVCALKTPGLETPSDFDGIVYISMDDKENWKTELLRELRAASMPLVEMT